MNIVVDNKEAYILVFVIHMNKLCNNYNSNFSPMVWTLY